MFRHSHDTRLISTALMIAHANFMIRSPWEKEPEGSNGLHNETWKNEIEATKAGAGYFLSMKGRPESNPSEYIIPWINVVCSTASSSS